MPRTAFTAPIGLPFPPCPDIIWYSVGRHSRVSLIPSNDATRHTINRTIDIGSCLDAPADDFDGRARPYDGDGDGTPGYDIGAYEVGALLEPATYLLLVVVA